MSPKMRGGRTGNRIARILAACVPDKNNLPAGKHEVVLKVPPQDTKCPEDLNNMDCIGLYPPNYLRPLYEESNLRNSKLCDNPTTSIGYNHTLIELTPQENGPSVEISELMELPIQENVTEVLSLNFETRSEFLEPYIQENLAGAVSLDFSCSELIPMEVNDELCEPVCSRNAENMSQENFQETNVEGTDSLSNSIIEKEIEDPRSDQVIIRNINGNRVLQEKVDNKLDDNVEQDPDYTIGEDDACESSGSDNVNEGPVSKKQKKTNSKLGKFARKEVEKRKQSRNSGKDYTTAKNKHRHHRKMRELRDNCRNKCKEKIDENIRQKIFHEYWSLGTHDKRVAYVASLINVKETEITRNKVSNGKPTKNRLNTYIYNLEINGQRIVICKSCFLNTLDETEKFISCTVTNKLQSNSGITHADKRGSHTPIHKTAQNKIDEVISHIISFPAYESHYSRRHTEKKYLAADLNLSKMYDLYCEKYREKPVSIKIYAREFHKLNLKFKKPKNDTCSRCDTLLAQQKYCNSEEGKANFKRELDEHLTLADFAYQAKAADKKKGLLDSSHITYVFDLQQVLQTPYLSTNKMFYLRQLATYNLTIHNCSSGESTHFMWPECTAGRGANEIASCIFAHLKNIPSEVKQIVFYSDTCGGQNKNSFMCAMFHYIINLHPTLEVIDHKFLVPGHTHLECDVDHALIERTKKKTSIDIHLPRDWYQLVKSASKKNKFKVEVMDQDRIFSFSELVTRTGPLQIKNKDFKMRNICWLRYTKESVVRYKNSLNEEEEFKEVKFLKKNQNESSLENFKLNVLYKTRRPISTKKKENLLEIVNLLDKDVQDYYRNLPTDKSIQKDTDPDVDRYLPEEECELF